MGNVLTSSALIESIIRRAMIPTDQNTFTNQDFLNMLNEEIQYFGVPHLMRTHEEYLVTFQDFAIQPDVFRFPIPARAVGNKLRDAAFIFNDSAFPDRPIRFYELSRVSLEDQSDFNDDYTADYTEGFFLEGNDLVLLDQPTVSDSSIRMYFYLKPNTLVTNDKAGVITAIDTTTGVTTLSEFPNAFSNLPKMDFVQAVSPNKIRSFDITPLSIDSITKTVTFNTTDLPDNLVVGDYLNVATESIVPQLPTELHAVLAQRVAIAALEAMGDTEGSQVAQRKLEMMEKSSTDLIDNRVEGAPEKIRARHNPLRQAVLGGSRFRSRGN